jgi:hypothetical protein
VLRRSLRSCPKTDGRSLALHQPGIGEYRLYLSHEIAAAILFDLDDTILVAFGPAQSQWQRTIDAFAGRLGPIEATVIAAAIQAASTELWA